MHHSFALAKSLQSCLTLRDPMDDNLPGSSVPRILQARILEGVAMPSSRGSSQPGTESVPLMSPALGGGFFTTRTTWEAHSCVHFECEKKLGEGYPGSLCTIFANFLYT